MRTSIIRGLVTGAVACALVADTAAAAPGDLDPTFSRDGRLVVKAGTAAPSIANDVLVTPEGRILTFGRGVFGGGAGAATALTPEGLFDPGFGSVGVAPLGAGFSQGLAAALTPTGSIIVAGIDAAGDVDLTRLNPDGSPDPSFGAGGTIASILKGQSNALDIDVTIDALGRIVLATTASPRGLLVARLTPDGALDPSFSGDGFFNEPASTVWSATGVETTPDGKIVVAGNSGGPKGQNSIAAARFDAGGTLDPTFSDDGIAIAPLRSRAEATDIAVTGEGKYLVTGAYSYWDKNPGKGAVMVRFDGNGQLDRSFARDGAAAFGRDDRAYYAAIALQADGRIVVSGGTRADALVARYLPNGRPDKSFSSDGRVATNLGANSDTARDVAIQPDGRIVAAGARLYVSPRSGGSANLALLRYLIQRGPADADADGRHDRVDRCPNLYARGHQGCPFFRRSINLKPANAPGELRIALNAEGEAYDRSCFVRVRARIRQVRSGPDPLIARPLLGGVAQRVPIGGATGRFYATVNEELVPNHGLCSRARSETVEVSP